MIKFTCNNCGRKLTVKDKLAGKRGKCPECSSIILVPEKSVLVSFQCQNCGRNISALPTQSGKTCKCPECKAVIIVPQLHSLTLMDAPVERTIQDQQANSPALTQQDIENEEIDLEFKEAIETGNNRKLPWIIDIFLYPTSTSGLIHLGIFTLLPVFIIIYDAVRFPLRMGLNRGFGFMALAATAAFSLYLCWFLSECIRDSAKGGTRVPEAFATADLSEMWSQTQYIISCFLIFTGPASLYYLIFRRTDTVFWILSTYGILFLPMALLACVMFDSIRGLNPVLLFASIFSTIVQYCSLVLLIGGIILLLSTIINTGTDQKQRSSISVLMLGAVFYALSLYAALIVSHLLGCFYRRNQEKLNWEV